MRDILKLPCRLCGAILALAGALLPLGEPAAAAEAPLRMMPVEVRDFSLHFGVKLAILTNGDRVVTVALDPVERGSLGEKAGLRTGDLLVEVEGRKVAGLPIADFAARFARRADASGFLTWNFTIDRFGTAATPARATRIVVPLRVKADPSAPEKRPILQKTSP